MIVRYQQVYVTSIDHQFPKILRPNLSCPTAPVVAPPPPHHAKQDWQNEQTTDYPTLNHASIFPQRSKGRKKTANNGRLSYDFLSVKRLKTDISDWKRKT